MQLITLGAKEYPKARCLDGTQGTYYFSAGSGDGVTKFFIYREGGAFCGSLEDCGGRSKGDLGSSKDYAPERDASARGFSRDRDKNPLMHNWNHVDMMYCDGMYYAGKQEEEKKYAEDGKETIGLHYKGGWIMEGVIDDLTETKQMRGATDVVIGGCSAGAISTVTTIDWVKSLVLKESPKAKVAGFVSSGYFLAYTFEENDYVEKKRYPFEAGNLRGQVSEACLREEDPDPQPPGTGTGKGHLCLIPEIAANYTATPLFFWESLYDSYMLGANLKEVPCQKQECAEEHGKEIQKRLGGLLDARKDFGAFVSGCSHHCDVQHLHSIEGKKIMQAFALWYGTQLGQPPSIRSWANAANAGSRARSSSSASSSSGRLRHSLPGMLARLMRGRRHLVAPHPGLHQYMQTVETVPYPKADTMCPKVTARSLARMLGTLRW